MSEKSLQRMEHISGELYKWKIRMRIGREYIHTHKILTIKDAKKLHAHLLARKAAVATGTPYTEDAPFAHKAGEEYTSWQSVVGLTQKHIDKTTNAIALLPDLPLNRIGRREILDWQKARLAQKHGKARKPTSPRTCNRARAELCSFFSWAIKQGYIKENPVLAVDKIKETPPQIKSISWDSFCKFADTAWTYRPALALFIEVLAETGARVDKEVIAANCEDVQENVWHKLMKGNRRSTVPAGPWLLHAKGDRTTGPLLVREDGTRWRYHVVARGFEKISAKAGVGEVTAHMLRHSRATWDLEANLPIRVVQKKMGHTTVTTTERYVKGADHIKTAESHATILRRPVPQDATKIGTYKQRGNRAL